MASIEPVVVKFEIDQPEITRALDDLHSEFKRASEFIGQKYAGSYKAAEQSDRLIDTYSKAVERVVASLRTSSDAGGDRG
jgi:hypothetical protein